LAKIRENSNQITVKIDKNVSLLYNYGNGKKSGIVTIPDCNTEKTPQSVYKV